MTNYKQPHDMTTIEEIFETFGKEVKYAFEVKDPDLIAKCFEKLEQAVTKAFKDYGDAREVNAKKEVFESLRMEKKTELEGFDTNQKEEFRRLGYNQAVQELNTKIDNIINQSGGK